MENEKTFRTKTGFCHILPDKIVLTRDGIVGNIAKMTVGNTITRILVIYCGLSLGLFYFAFDSYKTGQTFEAILLGLVALFLIYGIISSVNNSATPVIERNRITEVKFKKAIPGLTRSRFEVMFEDNNGKLKRRIIMLPGSLTDGQNETEKAIRIMNEENVLISP